MYSAVVIESFILAEPFLFSFFGVVCVNRVGVAIAPPGPRGDNQEVKKAQWETGLCSLPH